MRSRVHDFDLIVIGSGPGGQRAATQAAKFRNRGVRSDPAQRAETW
jgi:pyruvate/2-oxoglutarate dehydrogenase complex dihydrolipoamide dehydrogenase (E3) component